MGYCIVYSGVRKPDVFPGHSGYKNAICVLVDTCRTINFCESTGL